MSILLDALRKSEQRERRGGVPDIHSAEPVIESDPKPAWRAPALAVFLVAVLLGAGYGGWRWWTSNSVPVAPPEFTESAAVSERAATSQESTADPASSGVAAVTAPAPAPAMSTTPRLNTQPRSPVERLSGDRPYQPATPAENTAASAASRPASTRAIPEISDADLEAAVNQSEAAAEARSRQLSAAPIPNTGDRPRQRDPDEGLISVWQIPENVRGGLPEFRINVMVYDDEPSRRFIIMGGKRYAEGAEISGDLSLESVRRDRAIFRYGAYRFFVKR